MCPRKPYLILVLSKFDVFGNTGNIYTAAAAGLLLHLHPQSPIHHHNFKISNVRGKGYRLLRTADQVLIVSVSWNFPKVTAKAMANEKPDKETFYLIRNF